MQSVIDSVTNLQINVYEWNSVVKYGLKPSSRRLRIAITDTDYYFLNNHMVILFIK